MPWVALPFSERKTKQILDSKFKVDSIPTLIILAPDGSVVTADGRSAFEADPQV